MANPALRKEIEFGISKAIAPLKNLEKEVANSSKRMAKSFKDITDAILRQTKVQIAGILTEVKQLNDILAKIGSGSGKGKKADPALAAIVAQVKLLQHRNMLERDY
jgi:hypothetical protein